MSANLGKKFESIFRKDWGNCFPGTFLYRLPDQVSGYKQTSTNPCDFLAFNNGILWMLECKETQEGTINFAKIPQLDRLKDYIGLENVEQFIIVWYSNHDKVIACPASEALKMKADGKKLEEALQNVELTYKELVAISNDMLAPLFNPINELVAKINATVNALSIDQIRDYILQLQLKAFEISETKEKAALKAELADTLQKEKFATSFNGFDGSAAVKDKLALIETAPELVSETLYNLVANLLKTKVDQLHRLVDALKSILMSRMQENKFMNITTGQPGEKTYLTE